MLSAPSTAAAVGVAQTPPRSRRLVLLAVGARRLRVLLIASALSAAGYYVLSEARD